MSRVNFTLLTGRNYKYLIKGPAVSSWNWSAAFNTLAWNKLGNPSAATFKAIGYLRRSVTRNLSLSSGGVWNKKDNNKMAEASPKESSESGGGGGGSSVPANGNRSKCIFCKIADGKEGNEIYYQDDEIVVFQDIRPASKYHFLVVTREHIRDCKSLDNSHLGLLDRLVKVGNQVLKEQMEKNDAGSPETVQKVLGFHWPPFHTVAHLHLHVIAPSDQMGFMARTIFRPGIWFVTSDYVRERLEKLGSPPSGT